MRSCHPAVLVLILWLAAPPCGAGAETVVLPLSIDARHMRSLVLVSAFDDPGQTAVVLDAADGCTRVTLSRPRFTFFPGRSRLEVRVDLMVGAGLGGNCFLPVQWQGYVLLDQVPRVDTPRRQLWFETTGSQILGVDRRPARVAAAVWSLIEDTVYDYLAAIRIDLAPSFAELRGFLGTLFPPRYLRQAENLVKSMRPVGVTTTPRAVRVDLQARVGEPPDPPRGASEPRLSEVELDQLTIVWEAWDALLVEMISALAPYDLTDADRRLLLEVLLDTRHRFSAGLAAEAIGRDFVREQFISVWKRLSPLFRRHLGGDVSTAAYSYLAFFTAADALEALDRIGPSLGIEMSRDGLIRMARMLIRDRPADLRYHPGIHPGLRDVLDLGPPPAVPEESSATPRGRRPGERDGRTGRVLGWLGEWLVPAVAAAGKPARIGMKDIRPWMVPRGDRTDYLRRVRKLLTSTAGRASAERGLPENRRDLFRRIALATAWQESCFRQFTVRRRKVVYLLSYNRTSVGLMQIHERIWRGFYDRHHLRWNIRYNARAGCEILDTYLQRFALPKIDPEGRGGQAPLVAGALYAMYNGGPSQLPGYLKRRSAGRLWRSDELYFEKFGWVNAGRWGEIRRCLGGT